MEGLTQLERFLELNTPESRRIIEAHDDDRTLEYHQEVFVPLVKTHPSLVDLVGKLKKSDAIDVFNISKDFSAEWGLVALAQEKGLMGRAENVYAAEFLVENLAGISYCYQKFIEVRLQYFVSMVSAVKSISLNTTRSIEQVAQGRQYSDAIMRMIFPQRSESERFFNCRMRLQSDLVEVGRGTRAMDVLLGTRVWNGDIIPTKEAMDAFNKALREYKVRELDRTYS